MGFKTFLLNEGRSEPLDMDEAVELYQKNCKQHKWGKQTIYRGVDTRPQYPRFVDPSKHSRKSANTMNFYTLWIDNSKMWATYPKRSQSLICSTTEGDAESFGTPFIVVPYDNATIGVCPEDDFWNGFQKELNKLNLIHLHGFNQLVYEMVSVVTGEYRGVDAVEKNITVLTKWIKDADLVLKKNPEEARQRVKKSNWGVDIIETVIKYGGLMKMMDKVLDPKPNKFKVMAFKDFNSARYPSKEVWTDSPCIMFPAGEYLWDTESALGVD